MNDRASREWTRNGARCVLALILVIVGGLGMVASRAHVPSDRGATIEITTGLNVNEATPAELALLPGIGPTLSERIVRDREFNGPFFSVEDLDRVKGIGERRVMDIRQHAVAGAE